MNPKNARSLKGWLQGSERRKTPRESRNSEGGRSRSGNSAMVASRSQYVLKGKGSLRKAAVANQRETIERLSGKFREIFEGQANFKRGKRIFERNSHELRWNTLETILRG
jgi:hypothetical protein